MEIISIIISDSKEIELISSGLVFSLSMLKRGAVYLVEKKRKERRKKKRIRKIRASEGIRRHGIEKWTERVTER